MASSTRTKGKHVPVLSAALWGCGIFFNNQDDNSNNNNNNNNANKI